MPFSEFFLENMTLTRGTPPCTPHMEVPPPARGRTTNLRAGFLEFFNGESFHKWVTYSLNFAFGINVNRVRVLFVTDDKNHDDIVIAEMNEALPSVTAQPLCEIASIDESIGRQQTYREDGCKSYIMRKFLEDVEIYTSEDGHPKTTSISKESGTQIPFDQLSEESLTSSDLLIETEEHLFLPNVSGLPVIAGERRYSFPSLGEGGAPSCSHPLCN